MQADVLGVIKEYFEDLPTVKDVLEQVCDAATKYELAVSGNPDRKNTQEQRHDRHELVETLKELRIRLDPLHLPQPLMSSARLAYSPTSSGAPTLDGEIGFLLGKIEEMLQLFNSVDIPTPAKTNPGKPERDTLINDLVLTFESMASSDISYAGSTPEEVMGECREFVQNICNLIDPDIKIPRNL